MRQQFIYQDDKSHKFWDIEITGTSFTVYYGKAGTQGQTQTKDHASPAECKKAADKLIAEKTKKGYVAVTGNAPATEATTAPISSSSSLAEPGSFPPYHLYHDLLALADHLKQNPPEGAEVEVVPVVAENIDAMEAAAGFEMPEEFGMYWLRNGSLFFMKDRFICTVNAYNAQGTNANTLYGLLSFYQGFHRREFPLIEEERALLTQCFWLLGMIIDEKEMRLFVGDPHTVVHIVHFKQLLPDISNDAFEEAIAPLLALKDAFGQFIKPVDYAALDNATAEPSDYSHIYDDEKEEDPEAENTAKAAAEVEKQAFLDKHNIKEISYEDVLEAMGVDELFGYWRDDADNDSGNYSIEDYESEREYFEEYGSVYYCDGDLTIDSDLKIPHVYHSMLVVRGNLTVHGKAPSSYYVGGNTTVDYIDLDYFQKTLGTETVRYVASVWAEDHEVTRTLPSRKISAAYFISWFYDPACFEFSPETIIIALLNYDDAVSYKTNNAYLPWHDYAYALRRELYYSVEESHHDGLTIDTRKVYETLKAGQPILLDGVTPEGIRLTREGMQQAKEDDRAGAYLTYKEAIAKSPGYYLPYYLAGKCLVDENAYVQAMELFAKGVPLIPDGLVYEVGALELGAQSAVRVGQYDQAIAWGKAAAEKYPQAHFSLRVVGEALILQGKLDEAKKYLEQSIEVKEIFSNNWLLGLIYHLQGNKKKAEAYYKIAAKKNSKAQPYAQHTSLHYMYGDNVTVDWDTNPPAKKVKDQAYWDQYLINALQNYDPQWLPAKVADVPKEYRSKEMLLSLLEHQTKGEYDIKGGVLEHFDPALLTREIVLLAIQREEPCSYDLIPAAFLTPEVYNAHPKGLDLSFIPAEQLTYDLCFLGVTQTQYNYKHVPKHFQDERMNIALIAGGALQDYPVKQLPSRYYTPAYVKQALDLGMNVITKIPVKLIDKEVYAYATEKYGQDPGWPFIVEQYDRERWRWGSASTVESMGKLVQKHGINIFEHEDVDRMNKHRYGYYKKHLGHLPEFEEKAKAYGWYERRNETNEYVSEPEFDYDIFRKVWPCFWDEAFMIKALTSNERNSSERIYNVMPQHLTPKVCEVAVKKNSYDFQFVPRQWITPQLCEEACSRDYGAALEYVPIAMRTQKVCETSLRQGVENIKFMPLALRTPALCANILVGHEDLKKYVPYEHYAEVFETLSKKFKKRFDAEFLELNWGLGLIFQKDYAGARKKLAAVEASENADGAQAHQALYYIGWSHFLEGDAKAAQEYLRQAQDMAKREKIDDQHWLTHPYAEFQLPEVPGAYDFSQDDFDQRMREVTMLVENKDYAQALDILAQAEQQLKDSQYSEMRLWAYVWDHQRYALYEAGKKEESFTVCHHILAEVGKITLWDYLEEHNSIRGALRSAHNSLAYHCYETATDLKGVKEGLEHIKITMKTVSPIEDKTVLNPYYETHARLLHKAMGFDAAYQKDFDKVMTKITKSKLKDAEVLSAEFIEKFLSK
jgi:predicted DNA-binding WGR domain protein/tetratricopeptide (TPR) repeat protein